MSSRSARSLLPGVIVLIAVVLFGMIGPLATHDDPLFMDFSQMFHPPSLRHPFGVDNYGRDVLTRAMYGIRVSLLIGFLTAMGTTFIGLVLGTLAGISRRTDALLSRVIDAMMVFPDVLLAIALLAVIGGGIANVVLALAFVYSSRAARLVRALVLEVKENTYIEAARGIGCPTLRVVIRYILPNIASAVLVNATFCFAYAILGEAALSFLGLGLQPPAPTLGNMIAEAQKYMRTAPWLVVCPGSLIAIVVLGINLIGDAIRDIIDPFHRK